MQGITFSHINTKTFNIVLCVVLPLVTIVCLSFYATSLNKVDIAWLLGPEFLKLIAILLCYAVPLTYFFCKIFEIVRTPDSIGNSVFAFIVSGVLLLPLAFVALLMLAKLTFVIPMALTLAVFLLYYRSNRLITEKA